MSVGSLVAVRADKDVLTFERSEGDAHLFIAPETFAPEQRRVELPTDTNQALALLSTCLDRDNENVQAHLELHAPSEGVILKSCRERKEKTS